MLATLFNAKAQENTTMNQNPNTKTPPVCTKIDKQLPNNRTDSYYWLNERENPKVIDHLNAENAYTKQVMGHTEPLQEKLYTEMVARIKQDDASVPYRSNGYWYYTRTEEKKEYPIYCRKKAVEKILTYNKTNTDEQILLNVNQLAEGKSFCQIGGIDISTDNTLLVYGVDYIGRRQYELHFIDLTTGKAIADIPTIKNVSGGATWANDNQTIFYAKEDTLTLRSDRVFKFNINTKKETLIYQEKDETFGVGVYKDKTDQYIIIAAYQTLSQEYQFLDANKPEGKFKLFQKRQRELEYSISPYKDKFYITTNLDAKNFRVMECPKDKTDKANWKEVIAHNPDVKIESLEIFDNWLVVEERSKGLNQLHIINQNNKQEHYLNFGEKAYTIYAATNAETNTSLLRYGYTSMAQPNATYDYDMQNRTKILLKQEPVLGGFDAKNYTTDRIFATASDGTLVPISLVYSKKTPIDGTAPLLLYGYGSYGYEVDPTFSASRLSLIDRGFVFAIAHIRGGQIYGKQWYEDGKMFKKKNTFNDFIACGEHLIKQQYAAPNKLFASGGSAGGLLMGAIINIKPELWRGIVAAVPFVDVVTTMLDETIPLTTGEFDEWGNPKTQASYDYMLSYSPYDNVERKQYPNMLVTTGLHDSQVQYFEPAKWVAKLRELKTDNNTLLLYTNMEAGHGGASGRFQRYKEIAREYAFFLDLIDIKE